MGHGIGLEVHETPSLSPGHTNTVPENAVVTVEPGIYIDKSFGVRIEDMVLIKHNHAVNLTNVPKALNDCILAIKQKRGAN